MLRLWVCVLVAALGGALFLAAPVTREVTRTHSPRSDKEVERFGGTHALGQTFVAPEDGISEILVQLRPPVTSDAFPIFVHLRHGRYATRDIRKVQIGREHVSADGTMRVPFTPIAKSGGRPYTFVLAAPRARQSLAAYREIDGSIYQEGALFKDQADRPGDLEFSLSVRATRLAQLRHGLAKYFGPLFSDARSSRAIAMVVLISGALIAVPATVARLKPYLPRRAGAFLLGALVIGNVVLHIPFVLSYPSVNDEGSYLMDIQNLRAGVWPFRDTLAKGPLFLLLLAPVALLGGHSLIPARLLVTAASAVEVLLLYALARRVSGRLAGFLAAAFWALSPTAIAQTTNLLPQSFSLPIVTLAFILLLNHARSRDAKPPQPAVRRFRVHFPMLSGALFGAAYLVRASSAAFLGMGLLLPLLTRRSWPARLRESLSVVFGFVTLLGVLGAFLLAVIGWERTTVVFNIEAYTIGRARTTGGSDGLTLLPPREIAERLVAFGSSLFRAGLPLVLLWIASLSDRFRAVFRLPNAFAVIPFLGVSLELLRRLHAEQYFLPGSFAPLATLTEVFAILVLVSCTVLLLRSRTNTGASGPRVLGRELLLTGGSWLLLAMLYAQFGRFRQQYHTEFLFAYVVGGAGFLAHVLTDAYHVSAAHGRVRGYLKAVVPSALLIGTIAASFLAGREPTLALPHTGTIPLETAGKVGDVLRANSAPREEILTAQGLFTFYADRFLPFGAAHPGWYLEERVGTVPTNLRRLFLPDKEIVRKYVGERPIRLVAIDRRTREVYFQYDAEMRKILERDYRLLATVPNPLEKLPVEIWIRLEP